MPLPYARSIAEEHIYIDLHPCRCGHGRFDKQKHSTSRADQGVISQHDGVCTGCGSPRTFLFRLPGLAPRHADMFGGPDPSRIIDAGEWYIVFLSHLDRAERVKGRRNDRRWALETALGAIQEVAKFIPPGEDLAPDSAFFTERGRRILDREPVEFHHRLYIAAMIDGIREDLAMLA